MKDPLVGLLDIMEEQRKTHDITEARLMNAMLALVYVTQAEDLEAAQDAARRFLSTTTILGQPAVTLNGPYLGLFEKICADWHGRFLDTKATETA